VTRRALLLTGLVVACTLVVGGVVGYVLVREGAEDCGIPTEHVDTAPAAFVERDALVPAGTVGEERRPVVDAADRLPSPFGPVVAGRFYGTEERVPQLVAVDGDVVLAEPPRRTGSPASLQRVTLPDGAVTWDRTFTGGPSSGGPVGDLFVTAVGGSDPTILTVEAPSGELVGCVPAPAAAEDTDTTLLTDQAAADVVIAATQVGSATTLSRVDPAQGEVRWDVSLPGPGEIGGVTSGPDLAVVSRVGHDPVKLAELAAAGGIERPMVSAYSLDDGSPGWSYPADGEVAATAAAVLETDSASGATYVLAVRPNGTSRAVALDPGGGTRWERDLGAGYWDGDLWGDLLVMQGPDPEGGAVLKAFSATDGSPVWSLRSRDLPAPRRAAQRFGPSATLGDQVVMTAPGGLVLVDPATGEATPVRTSLGVDQVLPVGHHLVLRAGTALLVLTVAGA